MESGSDPRVYFAAERTLLAWVRTGLAFMGFGFILGRYRLFLTTSNGHSIPSLALGIALILLGVFTIVAPLIQFRRFTKTLPAVDLPTDYSSYPSILSAAGLAIFGLLLALYLLFAPADASATAKGTFHVSFASGQFHRLPGPTHDRPREEAT